MKRAIFLTIILAVFLVPCLAQTGGKDELEKRKKESSYYAPLRYVIVYNEILKTTGERELEILMDEKQFNEKNLLFVFELLKKRFPSPAGLSVYVHTNLATIETPDERELPDDENDSRFDKVRYKYKTASYTRSADGRESYSYTMSLSPYKDKIAVVEN